MSGQATRVQNNFSNRSKARLALERKPVFKSVLENPLQIRWPSVPMNLQNLCLARLLTCLESMLPHRRSASTSRREALTTDVSSSVEPGCHLYQDLHPPDAVDPERKDLPDAAGRVQSDHNSSEVGSHRLTIGINQVTRVLESQVRLTRAPVVLHSTGQREDPCDPCFGFSPLVAIFACSSDIDPPLLVEHIPYLVASCNSSVPIVKQQPKVKLVPLPKGAELAVAAALGLRRAAVIGVHKDNPIIESFRDILDVIPDLIAPWLSSMEPRQLVPTHIKQLRTTAPKDMKAAKEKRTRARNEAKGKSRSLPPAPPRRRLTLTADTVA